jgi:ABC-type transport system involved in cytochrome c biogenesis permease subunit
MNPTIEALLRRDGIFLTWEMRATWLLIALYLLSSFFYLRWLFSPKSNFGRRGSRLFYAAAALHTAIILLRAIGGAQLPCQTPYDGLLWLGCSSSFAYIIVEKKSRGIFAAGSLVSAVIAIACLCAVLRHDPSFVSLSPIYRNLWFIVHNTSTHTSYGLFVVAFSVEFGYVALAELPPSEKLPRFEMKPESMALFHRLVHQLVLFGFPLLTFGVLARALWAERVWDQYLSWGPEGILPVIAWTLYALYLHSMTMATWRGGRASLLNMLGFVCIVITLTGMNWMRGLVGIPVFQSWRPF